jgi:hypothetical protein
MIFNTGFALAQQDKAKQVGRTAPVCMQVLDHPEELLRVAAAVAFGRCGGVRWPMPEPWLKACALLHTLSERPVLAIKTKHPADPVIASVLCTNQQPIP